jgi:hypothetical protein
VWNEIVSANEEPAGSAAPEPEPAAEAVAPPAPPWPAPGPDAGWWRGDSPDPVEGAARPNPTRRRRRERRPGVDPAAVAAPVATATEPPVQVPGPAAAPDDVFPLWPTTPSAEINPGGAASRPPAPPPPPPPAPPAVTGGGGAENWPTPQMRVGAATRARSRRAVVTDRPRRPRRPRRPVVGLLALLVLAPLAGFVAWVSADPFWLALGHGRTGTATVTACTGRGLASRCTGTFTATGGAFSAQRVALASLPVQARRQGARVSAAMVSRRGWIAYAGAPRALHLRWALGLLLVILCGLAIAWATGASRLPDRRARIGGYVTSVAAPLLLLAGIVASAR